MLAKRDRIRTEYITYNNVSQIQYVHLCKDCKCEIWRTSTEEKKTTGYCAKCIFKHKRTNRIPLDKNGDKKCNICLRYLPLPRFLKNIKRKIYSSSCSKCHNLKSFGINALEYEELHKKQNGNCAICGKPESATDKHKTELRQLAVDHCHKKNIVRGLLCTNCNLGMGHYKDNIDILLKAIKYLTLHK